MLLMANIGVCHGSITRSGYTLIDHPSYNRCAEGTFIEHGNKYFDCDILGNSERFRKQKSLLCPMRLTPPQLAFWKQRAW